MCLVSWSNEGGAELLGSKNTFTGQTFTKILVRGLKRRDVVAILNLLPYITSWRINNEDTVRSYAYN